MTETQESLRRQIADLEDNLRVIQEQKSKFIDGMALVRRGDNLYVLGKPGAGKTTFLKFLTVQAARRHLNRIPIFVSLNQWANSKYDDLLPFIVRQFASCRLPDAAPFVEQLLQSGHALVLFDGLDEVKTEKEQRYRLTWHLRDFATEFRDCQVLITCRVTADQYDFVGFTDVEVADFDDEQVQKYAEKWFGADAQKFTLFQAELAKIVFVIITRQSICMLQHSPVNGANSKCIQTDTHGLFSFGSVRNAVSNVKNVRQR